MKASQRIITLKFPSNYEKSLIFNCFTKLQQFFFIRKYFLYFLQKKYTPLSQARRTKYYIW